MAQELQAAKAEGVKFVTYGESEIGVAVQIDDAIEDISSMEDEMIGEGTWYPCDEIGKI